MSIIKEVYVQLVCNHTTCGHVGGQYDTILVLFAEFLDNILFPSKEKPVCS